MITAPTYRYLHPPKTTGRYVRPVLRDDGATHEQRPHDGIRTLGGPDDRHHVATLRPPGLWLASLYYHALDGDERSHDRIRRVGGSLAFRDFVWGATHLTEVVDPPEALGLVYVPRGLAGYGGQDHDLGGLAKAQGWGLWSAVAWDLCAVGGRWGVDAVWDCTQIDAALATLIEDHTPRDPHGTRQQREAKHGVTGRVDDYRELYDAEMVGWVAACERPLLEALGWGVFEGGADPVIEVDRGPWPQWDDEALADVRPPPRHRIALVRELDEAPVPMARHGDPAGGYRDGYCSAPTWDAQGRCWVVHRTADFPAWVAERMLRSAEVGGRP